MARHRNIRTMNYDEECEEYYYEESPNSYDDNEFGISPTTAREYLYNPNDPRINQRIRTLSINEENEEDIIKEAQSQPQKLDSQTFECMEKVQDVVGDAFDDQDIIRAIRAWNYDHEKAIDSLLKRDSVVSSTDIRNKAFNIFPLSENISGFAYNAPHTLSTSKASSTLIQKDFIPSTQASAIKASFPEISSKTIPTVKPLKPVIKILSNLESSTSRPPQDSPSSIKKFSSNLSQHETSTTPEISPISTPKMTSKSSQVIKQKSLEEITTLYEEYLKKNNKPKINMVIVGHVDAGKSTIMGHLLYLKGSVSQKIIHRNEMDSKKAGKASFMFAWVLDQTEEERSRGVTIDVGQHHFQTDHRFVTILDAPGHRDFIPNMIVGATKADVAILVVDATNGEFETGFESGGQTQEHTLLLRSLGISQLAVVINKIDNANYSQDRFQYIQNRLTKFLKQVGFKENSLYFIPCSGLTGDNLIQKSDKPEFAWFKGKTLIQVIDEFEPNERLVTQPFRMSVKDVFKGPTSGVCVAGKIDSGFVETNQKLLVKPSNEVVTVKSLYNDEKCIDNAFAGDVLTINLNIEDSFELLPGTVLTDVCTLQNPVTKFEARIVVYNNITKPVILGFPVILYSVCVSEVAKISKMLASLNKKNEVVKKNPRYLSKNDNAIVEFIVQRPVWFELYQDFKEYGRFIFRSGDITIGAGVVTKLLA